MTHYYFEGKVTGGRTATILTEDGRFGQLDLVHYVLDVADVLLDEPTDKQITDAGRMTYPPLNQEFYFLFSRTLAESTVRIGEGMTMDGEPQWFVILAPENVRKAAAVRKQMFELAQWWRQAGQTPGILHISEGLDSRLTAGILTLDAYQAQWREITQVNGKTPRNVLHQLSQQKQLWTALAKEMRADPANAVHQLIMPDPGTAMQVINGFPDAHYLEKDAALYTSPNLRHEQYLKWLNLVNPDA